MKCPHCNENAPDNNYKCPYCGKVLQPDITPASFLKPPVKRHRINPTVVILLIIVIGVVVLIYAAFFKGKDQNKRNVNTAFSTTPSRGEVSVGYVVNSKNPGQEVDIQRFVQANKTTIFDFYSDYCGPCQRISPLLKRLDSRREDIIVHKVDINRSGIKGIDWGSPVARQYNIHAVPYFMIYDSSGNLSHKGKEAYGEVMRLLQGK
jgi:thiol-disulfide isomerase/thioredoxin